MHLFICQPTLVTRLTSPSRHEKATINRSNLYAMPLHNHYKLPKTKPNQDIALFHIKMLIFAMFRNRQDPHLIGCKKAQILK